jgi:hypothetical protein
MQWVTEGVTEFVCNGSLRVSLHEGACNGCLQWVTECACNGLLRVSLRVHAMGC